MTKLVVSFHSSLACLTCQMNEQSTSEKLEQETMQEPESGALCYNRGEAVETVYCSIVMVYIEGVLVEGHSRGSERREGKEKRDLPLDQNHSLSQ